MDFYRDTCLYFHVGSLKMWGLISVMAIAATQMTQKQECSPSRPKAFLPMSLYVLLPEKVVLLGWLLLYQIVLSKQFLTDVRRPT